MDASTASRSPPAAGGTALIAPLTGLRFAAAFAVLLFHSGAGFAERIGLPGVVQTFLYNGYLGVSLFFILSGFILTYTYDQRLNSRPALLGYAVFRFARLYPVYLFALLLALPVLRDPLTPESALAVLVLLQSWTPAHSASGYAWVMQAWTLSCEAFFYLCFPVALALLARLDRRGLWVGLALAAALLVGLAIPAIPPATPAAPGLVPGIAGLWLPLLRFVEFLYGMLIGRLMLTREPGPVPSWRAWLAAAAILVVLAACPDRRLIGIAAVLFGLLIHELAVGRSGLGRFLGSPPLVLLGGASYAIYLLHGPIREWVRVLVPSPLLGQFVSPPLTVAVSILVFLWLEEPARRWIRQTFLRSRQVGPEAAR